MSRCDILLVNPGSRETYGTLADEFSAIEPPVFLLWLAAHLRDNGFTVNIFDADAERAGFGETAERIIKTAARLNVIGVLGSNPSASSTPKMDSVISLFKILKKNRGETGTGPRKRELSPRTVLFGLHPSALPERTLRETGSDFLIRGEPFIAVKEILNWERSSIPDIPGVWSLVGGRIKGRGWTENIKNPDILGQPAWEMIKLSKYRAHNWHCFGNLKERSPYAVIYTSFGCPYGCSYCNTSALYGGKPGIRFRSPESVISEIELLSGRYGVRNIKIADELFTVDEKRVSEICRRLIEKKLRLNIWAYARIDSVKEKTLILMRRAGIRWLAYGIESGSGEIRSGVRKKGYDTKKIKSVIALTKKAGIYALGNYIFGLPGDTEKSMEMTFSLAEELLCEYSNFYTAMAYPGSRLYEESLRKGVEMPESWSGFGQLAPDCLPLPTEKLSSEEILAFRDRAFKRYHSSVKYLSMIEKTFGKETKIHIIRMLKTKIRRQGQVQDLRASANLRQPACRK